MSDESLSGAAGKEGMFAGIIASIIALTLCGIGLDILTFNMPDSARIGMSG